MLVYNIDSVYTYFAETDTWRELHNYRYEHEATAHTNHFYAADYKTFNRFKIAQFAKEIYYNWVDRSYTVWMNNPDRELAEKLIYDFIQTGLDAERIKNQYYCL